MKLKIENNFIMGAITGTATLFAFVVWWYNNAPFECLFTCGSAYDPLSCWGNILINIAVIMISILAVMGVYPHLHKRIEIRDQRTKERERREGRKKK